MKNRVRDYVFLVTERIKILLSPFDRRINIFKFKKDICKLGGVDIHYFGLTMRFCKSTPF